MGVELMTNGILYYLEEIKNPPEIELMSEEEYEELKSQSGPGKMSKSYEQYVKDTTKEWDNSKAVPCELKNLCVNVQDKELTLTNINRISSDPYFMKWMDEEAVKKILEYVSK